MRKTTTLFAALVLLTAGTLAAQAVPIRAGHYGFTVSDGKTAAGTFCSNLKGFSCTIPSISTAPGRILALTIRGPFGAPYLILAGEPAKLCVSLPGIEHKWLVPARFVVIGLKINARDTIRCWGGVAAYTLTVPKLPSGFTVHFQAVLTAADTKNNVRAVFTEAVGAKIG